MLLKICHMHLYGQSYTSKDACLINAQRTIPVQSIAHKKNMKDKVWCHCQYKKKTLHLTHQQQYLHTFPGDKVRNICMHIPCIFFIGSYIQELVYEDILIT